MHVDRDLAELIAQVFPTILIALLIEGRFSYRRRGFRWWLVTARVIRAWAIILSIGTTFTCLFFLGTGAHPSIWLDIGVTVSTFLLLLATGLVAGHVIAGQGIADDEKAEAERAERRAKRQAAGSSTSAESERIQA